jgi:hypothetical protein
MVFGHFSFHYSPFENGRTGTCRPGAGSKFDQIFLAKNFPFASGIVRRSN